MFHVKHEVNNMNITLYKTASENNRLNKSLTGALTLSTLREQTSIVHPTITIEHSNPSLFNYLYIADFNRYYFIKNITSVKNNLWLLECDVDTLMTYRSQIRNLNAIIDKQNYTSDMYVDDGTYVNQCKSANQCVTFANGFSESPNYVLITAGA